ncbi:unnamed protein product [Blepharisma stoltei]|uniref:Uncharacterized protein n=1 Tax=Blepharisma stoltei TaxID=1481888 RepID=A0AAU9JHI9_9CILI|nr:unnamed protein product [Blepharisma stoltei]
MDSNENNNSITSQEIQQFSPNHLSFVDEKEAKDHSFSKTRLSISTPTSYISDNSSQNSPSTKSHTKSNSWILKPLVNSNNNFGLEKSRFISHVDDHFICKICSYVVTNPVECESCENLVCKNCWINNGRCPHECEEFSTKKLAKYAASVYSNFNLWCKNHALGCAFSGIIPDVLAHEIDCLYIFVKCQNPLCQNDLLKADKYQGPNSLLVCSDVCKHIVEFHQENFEDPLEVLKNFSFHLEEAKKIMEIEIREEMNEQIQKIAKKNKQISEASYEKERLEEKIQKRLSYYHSGRWNVNSRLWSCCGNTNKYSNGCREIGD